MTEREICDVKHPMIRDADELWVYWYKENKFRLINRSEYPKPNGVCQLCPNGTKRTNNSVVHCETKVRSWSTFKTHLLTVERVFGELIAFPADLDEEDLPDVANYARKHRAYGQLADYQESKVFYIFDVKQNKFINVERNFLSKFYTKGGMCNYCPCVRKIQSPSSILQHLQSIENRFFCFLILDNESQNDERNKKKIMTFVKSIQEDKFEGLLEQSQEIMEPSSSNNSKTVNYSKFFESEEDEKSQSSEHLSINEGNERNGHIIGTKEKTLMNYTNDDNENNKNSILFQMQRSLKRDYKMFENYFNKLKGKVNVRSLDQSIINSQEQLKLTKKTENFETQEKNLSFSKSLDLEAEDLEYLMKKYDVPKSYRINNVEVNLNLALKPKVDRKSNNLNNSTDSLKNSLVNDTSNGFNGIQRPFGSQSYKLNSQIPNTNLKSNGSIRIKRELTDSENEDDLLDIERLRDSHY